MPVDLRFGAGCSNDLARELDDLRTVVMAFTPARQLGLAERWSRSLGNRLIAWIDVAEGLSSLATARDLASRVWPLLSDNVVLIAVGGGSTMDLAKVVRCRPRGDDFGAIAAALRGSAPWPALSRQPLWLLPTTAGTGSEVTRWATVWDTDVEPAVKRSLDEPWGHADRAFVDPLLTLSCPPSVTRDTALDALAHALEAIWNRHSNPISDRLAVEAARRIVSALPGCLQAPDSMVWRSELALAALQAGLAFSQTRTALAHALSYEVTLQQHLAHGLACALWLPTAWRLAQGRQPRVDALLAEVFADVRELEAWLVEAGAIIDPQALGIVDADARVHQALTSMRGRNFIAGGA
jgi:phosphonate metabolism-associated iron-containing alcohol dehydrogenase